MMRNRYAMVTLLIVVCSLIAVASLVPSSQNPNGAQAADATCELCAKIHARGERTDKPMAIADGAVAGRVCPGGKFKGQVPLNFAAGCGDFEVVKSIIAAGTPADTVDAEGYTPLMRLISNWPEDEPRYLKIANLLLERGASVSQKNKSGGWQPIHYAARWGSPESVTWLLKNEVQANVTTDDRHTPLMLVIERKGSMDCAEVLVKADPDIVESSDERGWHPIHFAADTKHEAAVQWLIDHKVDINSRTSDGKTALDIAIAGKSPEFVALLEKAGAKCGTCEGRPQEKAAGQDPAKNGVESEAK